MKMPTERGNRLIFYYGTDFAILKHGRAWRYIPPYPEKWINAFSSLFQLGFGNYPGVELDFSSVLYPAMVAEWELTVNRSMVNVVMHKIREGL